MSEIHLDAETGLPVLPDDGTGERRLLSLTPCKPMAIPRIEDAFEPIPRSEWRPTNRRQLYADRMPRYNQGQVGKCEPTSECEAIGLLRAIANLPTVRLSTGMAYALINNGQDRGAGIGDLFPFAQSVGICPEALMPGGFYVETQITQEARDEARKIRAFRAYHGQTFDELATAILLNFAVVRGVCVGRNFNGLGPNFVAPLTRGYPNHAVSAIDLVRLPNGEWADDDLNHWGRAWGDDGYFKTSESNHDAMPSGDFIAYESILIDADIDQPAPFI